MNGQCVPILVYHHVYLEETPELKQSTLETGAGIIGEAEFRRQIQYIADEGWNVVSTTQVVDWITEGTTLQEKVVALHFDNGWLDTAMAVLPTLRNNSLERTRLLWRPRRSAPRIGLKGEMR